MTPETPETQSNPNPTRRHTRRRNHYAAQRFWEWAVIARLGHIPPDIAVNDADVALDAWVKRFGKTAEPEADAEPQADAPEAA